MKQCSEMDINELEREWNAWNRIFAAPKGSGWPSNTARETAKRHLDEIEGWLARRNFEQDNPEEAFQ